MASTRLRMISTSCSWACWTAVPTRLRTCTSVRSLFSSRICFSISFSLICTVKLVPPLRSSPSFTLDRNGTTNASDQAVSAISISHFQSACLSIIVLFLYVGAQILILLNNSRHRGTQDFELRVFGHFDNQHGVLDIGHRPDESSAKH